MNKYELLDKLSRQFKYVLDNCFYIKCINNNYILKKWWYAERQYNNALKLNIFLNNKKTINEKLNFIFIYTALFGPFERDFSVIIWDNNELIIPQKKIFYSSHSRFIHLYNNKLTETEEINIQSKKLDFLFNINLFNNLIIDNDFSKTFDLILDKIDKLSNHKILWPLVVFDFLKNLYFLKIIDSTNGVAFPELNLIDWFKEIKRKQDRHSKKIKNIMNETWTSYSEIKDYISSQEYYNNKLDNIFWFLLEDTFCFSWKNI